jgi:lipoprotein NlpI
MRAFVLAVLLPAAFLLTPASAFCAGYDDLNAGIAAHNQGQWAEAIADFDKALAAGDLVADQQYIAHFDRARAHAARHEWDAAIADLSFCVDKRAGDNVARVARGTLYAQTGNATAAAQDLNAVLAEEPDNLGAYFGRAMLYEMQGEPAKELADLQAIQSRNKKDKAIGLEIGIAQFQLGQLDQAVALFAQSPGNPGYAWLWLAMANLKKGKPVPSDSSHLSKDQWPYGIVQAFLGKETEDAARASIEDGNPDAAARQGRNCEADFYFGEWRLLHGDAASGRPLIEKAAQSCPIGFIERAAAIAETKNAR